MTRSPWLAPGELAAWLSLQRGMALINDALDVQLRREAGITHGTYMILAMLSQAPGRALRMTDLARSTSSSQSRAAHAVARLERLGWVRREQCPTDRRGSVAVLTPAGFAVLEAAAPGHVAAVRRSLFDLLGHDDVRHLRRTFDSVAMRLDPDGAAVPPARS